MKSKATAVSIDGPDAITKQQSVLSSQSQLIRRQSGAGAVIGADCVCPRRLRAQSLTCHSIKLGLSQFFHQPSQEHERRRALHFFARPRPPPGFQQRPSAISSRPHSAC
jgi:hypothetical protein